MVGAGIDIDRVERASESCDWSSCVGQAVLRGPGKADAAMLMIMNEAQIRLVEAWGSIPGMLEPFATARDGRAASY